jgi:urease accessory protein
MLRIDRVLGSRIDPALSEHIHHVEHHGTVDILEVPVVDLARRRFVARTQSGEEVAVVLPREQKLFDGAVLLLEDHRALIVRAGTERWLRLEPRSIQDAIEVGYHAGNLHWRVRFSGEALLVALEGPVDDYLARLDSLIADRRVGASVVEAELPA